MQIQPDSIIWDTPRTGAPKSNASSREVFHMEKMSGDRMTGSMPVWRAPKTAEENIAANLSEAGNTKSSAKFADALTDDATAKAKDDSFGFLDFVDMINPLQHIPVVSTIYQKITGDTIKPVSQVVGGAAFGGPIGAAAGLVNALLQVETGKDVGGNMMASLTGGNTPKTPANKTSNDTTIALTNLRSSTLRTYNS